MFSDNFQIFVFFFEGRNDEKLTKSCCVHTHHPLPRLNWRLSLGTVMERIDEVIGGHISLSSRPSLLEIGSSRVGPSRETHPGRNAGRTLTPRPPTCGTYRVYRIQHQHRSNGTGGSGGPGVRGSTFLGDGIIEPRGGPWTIHLVGRLTNQNHGTARVG